MFGVDVLPLGERPPDMKASARSALEHIRRAYSPDTRDAWLVARFGVADLLRLELHTGRTHQIRVHLEHIGHPVVGDPTYGGGGSRRVSGAARREAEALERATPRQALHAAGLAFRHPATGAPMEFRAEWPSDLRETLRLAARSEVVAHPDPLAYLLFFNRDG